MIMPAIACRTSGILSRDPRLVFARTEASISQIPTVIPREAIPECRNGVAFDQYSRSLVVTRDRVSGVAVWTWYARPFLDSASIFQHPRSQWQADSARGRRRIPSLDSIALAAYVPAAGVFVTDRLDIPAACRRDADRYFPNARLAPQSDIDAVHSSLAKKPPLAWELADDSALDPRARRQRAAELLFGLSLDESETNQSSVETRTL